MKITTHPIQSREEWLRWRLADITASEIGALAGCDQHRSARAVYEEKVSGRIDDSDNGVLQRGRWQEAAVLEALQEMRPSWAIQRPREYVRRTDHRLGATSDALARDDDDRRLVVECKSVVKPVFEQDWSDGPPLKYQLQALANAMLRDADAAVIVALVRDFWTDDYREFPVHRHALAEGRILDMVADFWRRVEQNDPPEFDFSQDAAVIRQMYARPRLESVDLSNHNRIAELCDEKLRWQARKREADGALKTIDAEICAILGDAEIAEHPDYKITWKLQKRAGYTVEPNEFRQLRVTRRHKQEKAA